VDLGGPIVRTLAYGNTIPGQLIRADIGDELAVTVHNRLDQATSVHWHGIALRNDMDGVAPATPDIASGGAFTYRFSAPDPGTYWAHPHTGIAITDYGLYLPIIIDDPKDPGDYDTEWIVVLDDWTDGVGPSPEQILDKLEAGGMPGMSGMGGMDHGGMSGMNSMGSDVRTSSSAGASGTAGATGMGGMSGMGGAGSSDLLGGDAGDVSYPYYLINGRIPAAPTTFAAKPGQRIRIRIINAGADTAFRVALAGHRLTVTHTDGYPVQPRQVDALLLGMGERYDVIVTAESGVFPLVALAEGKSGAARALLRTGPGSVPDSSAHPGELDGQVGTVEVFTAADRAALPSQEPNLQLAAALGGDMQSYRWTINGRTFDQLEPLSITQGQRARLTFTNNTMMWHPMHLHGHTFQIVRNDGRHGPRKDTVIVLPMQSLAVDLQADNPGDWMLHCHNGYHMDAGMMTRLDYRI
jgi:FtsP/CotA-like multicopper oxidase with cupredoxin domain